jgi:ATP-dependent Clp protease ATP-binding subunit ClpA
MFEKFSERAIKAIFLAQEETRRLGHNSVGTELLLLGLILEPGGIAAKVLKAAGLDSEKARIEVEKIIGRGSGFTPVEIPFTPRAMLILEGALQKAKELGDSYVETEHLLLLLLDQEKGFGIDALESANVDRELLVQNILSIHDKRMKARKEANLLDFKQGDVVLVLFEETDDDNKIRNKRRPMVVISSDEYISRLSNVTVVPLVSHQNGKVSDLLGVIVDANSPAGKAGGLRMDCIVPCTFVYSYPKSWLVSKIGALPKETVQEIFKQVWNLIKPPPE